MIKELKIFLFISIIIIFFSLTLKFYFSDINKKNSYRSYKDIDSKINNFSDKLILLENNTNNTIKYVEKKIDKNKKKYNFWKLLNENN
tara:strand:+ start:298 stop:561 length:264 start_codon:yes stop_codon:yes gene_type:complete